MNRRSSAVSRRNGGLEQRRGQPFRGGDREIRQRFQWHPERFSAMEVDEEYYWVFLYVENYGQICSTKKNKGEGKIRLKYYLLTVSAGVNLKSKLGGLVHRVNFIPPHMYIVHAHPRPRKWAIKMWWYPTRINIIFNYLNLFISILEKCASFGIINGTYWLTGEWSLSVNERYIWLWWRCGVNQSCENQRRRLSTHKTLLKARVILSWLCSIPPPIPSPPLLGMTRGGALPSPQYESDGALDRQDK